MHAGVREVVRAGGRAGAQAGVLPMDRQRRSTRAETHKRKAKDKEYHLQPHKTCSHEVITCRSTSEREAFKRIETVQRCIVARELYSQFNQDVWFSCSKCCGQKDTSKPFACVCGRTSDVLVALSPVKPLEARQ